MFELKKKIQQFKFECSEKQKRKNNTLSKYSVYSVYIYQNKLDKACFQHDMAYRDFKDLNRRAAANKVLRDNAFDIAENPKYDGCQRGIHPMPYRFFDKKFPVVLLKVKIVLIKK